MNHENTTGVETSPGFSDEMAPAHSRGCRQARPREQVAFVLPGSTTTAPGEARHRTVKTLQSWGVPQACTERVELIVSELATNAVKHTASRHIRLEIALFADAVTVSVHDRGPRPSTPIRPRGAVDAYAVSGRGLGIVETLSLRWGVQPTSGEGSLVWATVALAGAV